jgi:hypothetical protein
VEADEGLLGKRSEPDPTPEEQAEPDEAACIKEDFP